MANEQRVDYDVVKDNIDKFEAFYFAALMKSGEHGKEGQRDGLYASLYGIRNIGLEGILKGLEAIAEDNIGRGNGINAKIDLDEQISGGAKIFLESYQMLKPKDIAEYVKDRLGIDIEVRGDQTIKEISENLKRKKEAGEEIGEEKDYIDYLLSQGRNAVMAKMTPIIYQERAKKVNAAFSERYN